MEYFSMTYEFYFKQLLMLWELNRLQGKIISDFSSVGFCLILANCYYLFERQMGLFQSDSKLKSLTKKVNC